MITVSDNKVHIWLKRFLEFILGSQISARFIRFVINPWLVAGTLFVMAVVAATASIVANTHVAELIVGVTVPDLGSKPFKHSIQFGYLLEPNFFLWLTFFLPTLGLGVSLGLQKIAKTLSEFSDRAFPRLHWPYSPLESSLGLKSIFSRVFLALIFVGLPIFSCYFQEVALLKAIQLPRTSDENSFASSFDFGNTQAPTLGALVARFNALSTDRVRFVALHDRLADLATIRVGLAEELKKAKIVSPYVEGNSFNLEAAIAKADASLHMTLSLDEKRFDNTSSFIAFPAYRLIVYSLQGLGWGLGIFAIYVLGGQFFVWYSLIQDGKLVLQFEDPDKNFGLEPLQDILALFYVLVVIGASYVLFQCISPIGWQGILSGGKGGTFEFRILNMSLVALTVAIFGAGILAIEIQTRFRRHRYINDHGLNEAVKNAISPEDQTAAEMRLKLVEKQRFFTLSFMSVWQCLILLVALGMPFWISTNSILYSIWDAARVHWVEIVCSSFQLP